MSILPPDQYLAIVLQATLGCSWNRCAFCDFYQGTPFSARAVEEFREHVEAVRALLGRGERLRKWIFLADGNALVLSSDRLRPLLACATESFPGRQVAGFVDVFSGEKKAREEWEDLRASGLARVHVGVETGHDPLLRWMNKPGGARDAAELVAALKEAAIQVSVIVMCGIGGERFAEEHVSDTRALLAGLPLAAGDIVYLSPFVEHPGSAYARIAAEQGMSPLSEAGIDSQISAFRDAVRRAHPGVRASRYDLDEFVY